MQQVELRAPQRRIAVTVATVALMILLNLPFVDFFVHGTTLAATVQQELLYWGATIVILAYVRFIERRPLTSIGLSAPTWKSLLWGIIAAITAITGIVFIYLVVFPVLHLSDNADAVSAIAHMPLWLNALIVLRAGVFEEVFYRGFMIERLAELTRLRWLAAAISLAVFTYAHLAYWGWTHLIIAGFGGLVLTALYLWRRDLTCNIAAHFLTDAGLTLLA